MNTQDSSGRGIRRDSSLNQGMPRDVGGTNQEDETAIRFLRRAFRRGALTRSPEQQEDLYRQPLRQLEPYVSSDTPYGISVPQLVSQVPQPVPTIITPAYQPSPYVVRDPVKHSQSPALLNEQSMDPKLNQNPYIITENQRNPSPYTHDNAIILNSMPVLKSDGYTPQYNPTVEAHHHRSRDQSRSRSRSNDIVSHQARSHSPRRLGRDRSVSRSPSRLHSRFRSRSPPGSLAGHHDRGRRQFLAPSHLIGGLPHSSNLSPAISPQSFKPTGDAPDSTGLPLHPRSRSRPHSRSSRRSPLFRSLHSTSRHSQPKESSQIPVSAPTTPWVKWEQLPVPPRAGWPGRKLQVDEPLIPTFYQAEAFQAPTAPGPSGYFQNITLDYILRQIYLCLLLRLPSLYFSRVTLIFEEAEASLREIRKMAVSQGDMKSIQKAVTPFYGGLQLPPYNGLKISWEVFVDSLTREWKTLNIISVLLLSAILTILQIQSAANDPLIRYAALLSLICALMSLLYGCLYIIQFGTMKKTHKAAEWADEAQKTIKTVWWNVSILLAMPAIWLSWSIILYVICIMSFVWRSGITSGDSPVVLAHDALWPRILISAVLGLGLLYFTLIITTFWRYGNVLDEAWKGRVAGWAQESEMPPLPQEPNLPPSPRRSRRPRRRRSPEVRHGHNINESSLPPRPVEARSRSPTIHNVHDRNLPAKIISLPIDPSRVYEVPHIISRHYNAENNWKAFVSRISNIQHSNSLPWENEQDGKVQFIDQLAYLLEGWNEDFFVPNGYQSILVEESSHETPNQMNLCIYLVLAHPFKTAEARFNPAPDGLARLNVIVLPHNRFEPVYRIPIVNTGNSNQLTTRSGIQKEHITVSERRYHPTEEHGNSSNRPPLEAGDPASPIGDSKLSADKIHPGQTQIVNPDSPAIPESPRSRSQSRTVHQDHVLNGTEPNGIMTDDIVSAAGPGPVLENPTLNTGLPPTKLVDLPVDLSNYAVPFIISRYDDAEKHWGALVANITHIPMPVFFPWKNKADGQNDFVNNMARLLDHFNRTFFELHGHQAILVEEFYGHSNQEKWGIYLIPAYSRDHPFQTVEERFGLIPDKLDHLNLIVLPRSPFELVHYIPITRPGNMQETEVLTLAHTESSHSRGKEESSAVAGSFNDPPPLNAVEDSIHSPISSTTSLGSYHSPAVELTRSESEQMESG